MDSSTALDATRPIYAVADGTWVENSATRHYGSILITLITKPEIYMFDPRAHQPEPYLVNFDGLASVAGITESSIDTFLVVVSNLSLATLTATAGTNHVYGVTFPRGFTYEPGAVVRMKAKLTASIPDAGLLNGFVTLNNYTTLLQHCYQRPATAWQWRSWRQRLFAKVEIDLAGGTAKGAATILAQSPGGTQYDDSNLNSQGNAYMAVRSGNEVSMISAGKMEQRIIAGMVNGTAFVQPTSISYDKGHREGKGAYVTTRGGRLLGFNLGKQR